MKYPDTGAQECMGAADVVAARSILWLLIQCIIGTLAGFGCKLFLLISCQDCTRNDPV